MQSLNDENRFSWLPCDRSKQVVLLIVEECLWSQIKQIQKYPGSLYSTAHSQIVSNTR